MAGLDTGEPVFVPLHNLHRSCGRFCLLTSAKSLRLYQRPEKRHYRLIAGAVSHVDGNRTSQELRAIITTEGRPMSWWERWTERQYQLAQGVDADLVRANHHRFRWAFGLLVFAFLLGIVVSKHHLPSTQRFIVDAIVIVAFLVGFVLAAWSRQEAAFLSKPGPQGPPKIFK